MKMSQRKSREKEPWWVFNLELILFQPNETFSVLFLFVFEFEKKNTAVLDVQRTFHAFHASFQSAVFTEARNVMRAEEAMALKATKKRCLSRRFGGRNRET